MRSRSARRRPAGGLRVAFGKRVRTLRTSNRWTQADLAERSALDVSFISQIERGLRDPSLASLQSIAAAFGLTLAQLLALELDPPRHESAARAIAEALEDVPVEALDDIIAVVRIASRLAHGAVAPSRAVPASPPP